MFLALTWSTLTGGGCPERGHYPPRTRHDGESGAACPAAAFCLEHRCQLVFGGLFHPELGRPCEQRVVGFGEPGIVEHEERLDPGRLPPIPVGLVLRRSRSGLRGIAAISVSTIVSSWRATRRALTRSAVASSGWVCWVARSFSMKSVVDTGVMVALHVEPALVGGDAFVECAAIARLVPQALVHGAP